MSCQWWKCIADSLECWTMAGEACDRLPTTTCLCQNLTFLDTSHRHVGNKARSWIPEQRPIEVFRDLNNYHSNGLFSPAPINDLYRVRPWMSDGYHVCLHKARRPDRRDGMEILSCRLRIVVSDGL